MELVEPIRDKKQIQGMKKYLKGQIKGAARNGFKPVTIGDKEYLITNDFYKYNVDHFIEWSKRYY